MRQTVKTCITISKKHIFVGLVEEYAYIKDPLRPREIMKMDRDGLRIKSTDKTEKLSIFSDRCTINPLNNDLIVSGYECGYQVQGVLVNFNPEGKLIFIYKEERPFIPFTSRGLTCSPNGNILVCKGYNGDVTILDSRLQLIKVRHCMFKYIWETTWCVVGQGRPFNYRNDN